MRFILEVIFLMCAVALAALMLRRSGGAVRTHPEGATPHRAANRCVMALFAWVPVWLFTHLLWHSIGPAAYGYPWQFWLLFWIGVGCSVATVILRGGHLLTVVRVIGCLLVVYAFYEVNYFGPTWQFAHGWVKSLFELFVLVALVALFVVLILKLKLVILVGVVGALIVAAILAVADRPHSTSPNQAAGGSSASATIPGLTPSDSSSASSSATPSTSSASPSSSSSAAPSVSASPTPNPTKTKVKGTAAQPIAATLENVGPGDCLDMTSALAKLRSTRPAGHDFAAPYDDFERRVLRSKEEQAITSNTGKACLKSLAARFSVSPKHFVQYMRKYFYLRVVGPGGLVVENSYYATDGSIVWWQVQRLHPGELYWASKSGVPLMLYVCLNVLKQVEQHPSGTTPAPKPTSSTPTHSTPSTPPVRTRTVTTTPPAPKPTPSKTHPKPKPPTHTYTPPPPKPVSVSGSCQRTFPEEISGDGNFEVDCTASSSNGAAVSVTITPGNGYVSVSKTSLTVASGGSFSFRMYGHNDSGKIQHSSLSVTFRVSGASGYWSSGQFDVDPQDGGF